jgi:predicted unusual protein kinase regulating ubiquinone biosynthesis (AarF/ABC1/UbiB family)
MGQILSSRPDFMPYQYIHCFTNLQDKVPAYDTDLIQKTAIEALRRDCPAYDMYEDVVLDPLPLGSASIGQVHRATLRPKKDHADNRQTVTPKEVAIKIMHQGAKEKFQNDFQVFRWLCRIAIPSWCQMLDALEQQVMTEFNYLQEAESLRTVRNNMLQSRYRDRVCIPEPMMELCCENVLVMELLQGKKLTEAIHDKLLMAMGGNKKRVGDFLKQRKYEVLMGGHDTSVSDAMLHSSVNLVGKWKLLRLFQQCRRVVDLLVDVHGYQIFRTGMFCFAML